MADNYRKTGGTRKALLTLDKKSKGDEFTVKDIGLGTSSTGVMERMRRYGVAEKLATGHYRLLVNNPSELYYAQRDEHMATRSRRRPKDEPIHQARRQNGTVPQVVIQDYGGQKLVTITTGKRVTLILGVEVALTEVPRG